MGFMRERKVLGDELKMLVKKKNNSSSFLFIKLIVIVEKKVGEQKKQQRKKNTHYFTVQRKLLCFDMFPFGFVFPVSPLFAKLRA